MTKNIIICCDGTGNEVDANLSNVLKLFRTVQKNERQMVFYDPGIGTLGSSDAWSHLKNTAYQVFGLATGWGLDENVLDAYRFLVDHYDDGDSVYLFGFSRGAYTARVLGGFLRLVGLVQKPQRNLSDYALTAYKRAAEKDQFEIAWRFQRVISTRRVPIRFVGVWDTVSSVFVPRPDRFYIPSLQVLPYTKTNSYVEVFRQALAIDERRRLFKPDSWTDPQQYAMDPFTRSGERSQDIKQVWFAGVHSDVGGGYAEEESGLAKYPLGWLIDEAVRHGLLIDATMYDHLVLGMPREGGSKDYVAPDPAGPLHKSMKWYWRSIDWFPKARPITDGSRVHASVFERMARVDGYRPVNVPPPERVIVEAPSIARDTTTVEVRS